MQILTLVYVVLDHTLWTLAYDRNYVILFRNHGGMVAVPAAPPDLYSNSVILVGSWLARAHSSLFPARRGYFGSKEIGKLTGEGQTDVHWLRI